jgi:SNF2 family DNA or RNA helicase
MHAWHEDQGQQEREGHAQVVKAEVVLMTYEALATDQALISQITWEMVVLDERNRKRAGKQAAALSALSETLFSPRHRLLISQGRPLEVRPSPCPSGLALAL